MKRLFRAAVALVLMAAGLTALSPPAGATVSPAKVEYHQMTGGYDNNCALDHDGYAYCWGYNGEGELGDGTTTYSSVPVAVAGGHQFVSIDGSYDVMCALTAVGELYCWGSNSSSALGDGTGTDSATPVLVTGGNTWLNFGVNDDRVCAVDTSHTSYCWGYNGDGALGDGTTTDQSSPTPVATSLHFVSFGGSYYSMCGLTASGSAYCWGSNAYGELGDGSNTNSHTPVAVAGGHTFARLSQVKDGSGTCGVDTDGAAWCWGFNASGQLGNGTTTNSNVPVHAAPGLTFQSITTSSEASCGLLLNGKARCWGYNGNAVFGNGSYSSSLTPVAPTGDPTWEDLALGADDSACGLDTTHNIRCWGNDGYGQLGDNTARQQNTYTTALTDLTSGGANTCGLDVGGAAQCLGGNFWGQLGNGANTESASFVPVSGGHTFASVTAGSLGACALTGAGVAWCWGYNQYGSLGDGTTTNSNVPVAVTGGHAFSSITSDSNHSCALTSAGAAWCWGNNTYGQLGDGTTTGTNAPVAVSGGHAFASIVASNNQTCGLTAAGAAWCWGYNGEGELGDGTQTNSPSPVAVTGSHTFSSISQNNNHTCGLDSAGAAWCWGFNYYGELGNGTTHSFTATPVAVSGGHMFSSIRVETNSVCALTAGGSTWCWGYDGENELGTGTAVDSTVPVASQTGHTFTSLIAGNYVACGLNGSTTLRCWGAAYSGQLGAPTTASPGPIAGSAHFGNFVPTFSGAATNTSQSIFVHAGLTSLDAADGDNDTLTYTVTSGSLPAGITLNSDGTFSGTMTSVGSSDADIDVDDGYGGVATTSLHIDVTRPISPSMPGAATVAYSHVSAGEFDGCALDHDGYAYCWGAGFYGALGNGDDTHDSPTPTAVSGGHKFVSIQSSTLNTCGLTANGDLYCWGANYAGELGDGTTTNSSAPVLVLGGHSWTNFGVGQFEVCAVDTTQTSYCWGSNYNGALGDGLPTSYSATPSPVATAEHFVSFGGSAGSMCGLTGDGVGFCWGDNTYGNLGEGTNTSETTPVPIDGGHIFKQLAHADNGYGMCGLDTGGAAWCWGYNANGQIGDGTQVASYDPVQVAGGIHFNSLFGGQMTSCGLTAAGDAYCWGKNNNGVYGNGTYTDSYTPVPAATTNKWKEISVNGGDAGCGLTLSDQVKCWGAPNYGQIGDNNVRLEYNTDSAVHIDSVVVGNAFGCVLTSYGTYCDGDNTYGQLGDGTNNNSIALKQVAGHTFTSISAGFANACAIDDVGAAWCWGWNPFGSSGDGTNTSSNTPVAVSGGHTFTSISSDNFSTCAVDTLGAAWCWGYAPNGQLGNGSTTDSWTPVAVSGGHTFTSVSTNGFHSCGLAVGGAAWCWGDDTYGALGDASVAGTSSSTPVAVAGGHAFTSLTTTYGGACGADTLGAGWCWGTNYSGELGNGSTDQMPHDTPVAIVGGHTFTSFTSETATTCGLTTAGKAWCWGRNSTGQLGIGTTADSVTPVAAESAKTFTAISGSSDHMCGVTADGVTCWGDPVGGALGTNASAVPAVIAGSVYFGNVAPTISSVGTNTSQSVVVGAGLTSLAATDDDSDTLSYSVASGALPAGITLNTNGSFGGTTTAAGSSDVVISVNDGHGASVNTSLHVDVAGASVATPPTPSPTSATPPPSVGGAVGTAANGGYWLSSSSNSIKSINGAPDLGSVKGKKLNAKIVGVRSTPSGNGYYQFAKDGGVFTFGDAKFFGSTGSIKLKKPIVGMSVTPSGNGYWLVAADGGVFAFGDANFYGSLGGGKVSSPIVSMSATPSGLGYWLVAKNGAVYSFGDAQYFGGMNGQKLHKPITAIASTLDGQGYWLLGEDGGVFSYGDAVYLGSNPKTSSPAIGLIATAAGDHYAIVRENGSVENW